MHNSMVICPRCGEPMHVGPVKVEQRITFAVTCFSCPLISELETSYPAKLRDLGRMTYREAEEYGVSMTPLTRTATPLSLKGES
jgi:hypothetical protein